MLISLWRRKDGGIAPLLHKTRGRNAEIRSAGKAYSQIDISSLQLASDHEWESRKKRWICNPAGSEAKNAGGKDIWINGLSVRTIQIEGLKSLKSIAVRQCYERPILTALELLCGGEMGSFIIRQQSDG